LANTYFEKAVKWLNSKLAPPSLRLISHKLIPLDKFQTVYERLKAKYLETLIKNWESESTNAEKFISEVAFILTNKSFDTLPFYSVFFSGSFSYSLPYYFMGGRR